MADGEIKDLGAQLDGLDLPIMEVVDDMRAQVAASPLTIIAAPPGAGKTTVVPLLLAGERWAGPAGRIIVLEPRRLAARAAAQRMAELAGGRVGDLVGLRARLETRVGARTRIEVVTEGVFTRMILDDPALEGVAAVVFDEFHERSVEADLALALVRDSQSALRADLKIVLMSATLDLEALPRALGDPPVVASRGRMYPVETVYLGRPRQGSDIALAAASAAVSALGRHEGSVLVFLPGAGEIRRAMTMVEERLPEGASVDVHGLFGAMDPRAQDAAIAPPAPGRRKVVLASPIAETSLTIEGVGVVIDAGLKRQPRFDPRRGLTRLETVRVTRANAEQRRGRAGRLGPGTCYRLWAREEDRALAAHPPPEILQADLSALRLAMAVWGARRIEDLAWVDAPPRTAFRLAEETLATLGALDAEGQLTPLGRRMARLGVAPRLSAMLCGVGDDGDKVLAGRIAAVLSEDAGGRDIDLRFRVEKAMESRPVRALAERLARMAGAADGAKCAPPSRAGRLLALAYPGRVARRRRADEGVYQSVDGQGARLDAARGLAGAEWIVIADAQGAGADLRVRLAAPIGEEDVLELFGERAEHSQEVSFDAGRGRVVAERVSRLGAIVLSARPLDAPPPEKVAAALVQGVRARGIDDLPFSEAARSLIARVSFARRVQPEAGWPDLDMGTLERTLETWLGPFLAGKASVAEIGAGDLSDALFLLVPQGVRARIDTLLPARFETPAGNAVAIDYAAEGGPSAKVRVQALFGLDRHPMLLDGAVPLRLELLSPAGRPIQVTADLPAFWRGSWKDVRAQMRGRYPKHPWPQDPATAPPTLRAKPRGRA